MFHKYSSFLFWWGWRRRLSNRRFWRWWRWSLSSWRSRCFRWRAWSFRGWTLSLWCTGCRLLFCLCCLLSSIGCIFLFCLWCFLSLCRFWCLFTFLRRFFWSIFSCLFALWSFSLRSFGILTRLWCRRLCCFSRFSLLNLSKINLIIFGKNLSDNTSSDSFTSFSQCKSSTFDDSNREVQLSFNWYVISRHGYFGSLGQLNLGSCIGCFKIELYYWILLLEDDIQYWMDLFYLLLTLSSNRYLP